MAIARVKIGQERVSLASNSLIPADLAASIESQTGATIDAIVLRGGGGASRLGAEVTLRRADGSLLPCYLSYDTRTADPKRMPHYRREVAILRALSGALADSGVRVPVYVAHEPAHLAILCSMVAGADRFDAAGDKGALAADLAVQLAKLHAIDTASLALDGFDDPAVPPSQRVKAKIAEWRKLHMAATPDPVLILALDWLAANVPVDDGPSVLLHGDAGPGNFLHSDNRIGAMIDWELTHYGDPHEDLAQCWVRSLFQPFVPMRDFVAAYEREAGRVINLDRLKFYRLFFQMSFIAPGHAGIHAVGGGAEVALMGMGLVFHTAHMRVIVESLAELTGQTLIDARLPEVPAAWIDKSFEAALSDLRHHIVPRVADQQAAAKAKSLARLVKYWQRRERYGAAFDRMERESIGKMLVGEFDDGPTARRALAKALVEGRIGRKLALQQCHERMMRDTFLMAEGMGAFATCYFPPFDGDGSQASKAQ